MAKDENAKSRSFGKINKSIESLEDTMDSLYQSTYSSRTDNKNTTNSIFNTIEDNLDKIINDINNQNVSDIANLYSRINKDSGMHRDLEELLTQKGNIIDTINLDNVRRYIQSMDYQIDLICRYMPKLQDALDIMKDNVLSSDSFTKEFINATSKKSSKEYLDIFTDRAAHLKEKYNIEDLYDEIYDKTGKYGEYFLYHVPYSQAFERLLKRKQRLGLGVRYESVFESSSLTENSLSLGSETIILSKEYCEELKSGKCNVNIIFEEDGIIPEPIQIAHESVHLSSELESHSLCESFFISSNLKESSVLRFEDNGLSTDGLMTGDDNSYKVSDKINGSVLYEIPRGDILPVFMHTHTIGYLHLQVDNDYVNTLVLNGNSYNSLTNNTKMIADELDKQNDLFVSYLAGTLSDKINTKFINSNIDLKESIYAVLRYNDKLCCTRGTNNIRVSFLPAEDVEHYYFKLNKETHRGISDLDKAIVPGMIYCLLYLNNVIGKLSREQDKRVYYVKQNVEQNVAKTLMNVIAQIKKGNMGMRQLENMNTIFNVIGRYNDHIIPMSQSGDAPIQMEVMQGQQIETPTDLMDRMEENAIESADVPLEFVNSIKQVDYASRFTMSNSKFLRKVYKRQRICQKLFTINFRKLYNFEYKEHDSSIQILLPAPAYMAMTNGQQLLNNVKDYVTGLADIVCTGKEEDIKSGFINLASRHYLGTYVDFDMLDDMVAQTELELQTNKVSSMGSADDSSMSDIDDEY